jgi:hypothetical protein
MEDWEAWVNITGSRDADAGRGPYCSRKLSGQCAVHTAKHAHLPIPGPVFRRQYWATPSPVAACSDGHPVPPQGQNRSSSAKPAVIAPPNVASRRRVSRVVLFVERPCRRWISRSAQSFVIAYCHVGNQNAVYPSGRGGLSEQRGIVQPRRDPAYIRNAVHWPGFPRETRSEKGFGKPKSMPNSVGWWWRY